MWEKAKDFIQRAFTVIFLATVIIGSCRLLDAKLNVVEDSSDSLLAMIGRLIAPIFVLAGFGIGASQRRWITGITARKP
jgi:ferrous iron transport protein B